MSLSPRREATAGESMFLVFQYAKQTWDGPVIHLKVRRNSSGGENNRLKMVRLETK